jgi:hypothetical protein
VFGTELVATVIELTAQGKVAALEKSQRRAECEDQKA